MVWGAKSRSCAIGIPAIVEPSAWKRSTLPTNVLSRKRSAIPELGWWRRRTTASVKLPRNWIESAGDPSEWTHPDGSRSHRPRSSMPGAAAVRRSSPGTGTIRAVPITAGSSGSARKSNFPLWITPTTPQLAQTI